MVDYQKLSDDELVLLLRAGDHAAYTYIYDKYSGLLYVFAYKRLKDREEAKDIIHELFLSLWRKRATFSLSTGLSPYLYIAVKNRIINVIARQKVSARYINEFAVYLNGAENGADHLARHNDLQQFIANEISALPPRMRQIFELSRKTNLSRKEIAEELRLSEETVKSHMHAALKILKLKLGSIFYLLF